MKELRFYPGSLSIGDNKIRKKIQKVIQLKGKKNKRWKYIYIYKQHSSLSFGFFFSNS